MSQSRLDDLYDRLTSRKLLLALVSIALAAFSYHQGALTAAEFQQAVMVAVTAYTAAEGASDAAAAWKTSTLTPEQRGQIVADLKAEMIRDPEGDDTSLVSKSPEWLPAERS